MERKEKIILSSKSCLKKNQKPHKKWRWHSEFTRSGSSSNKLSGQLQPECVKRRQLCISHSSLHAPPFSLSKAPLCPAPSGARYASTFLVCCFLPFYVTRKVPFPCFWQAAALVFSMRSFFGKDRFILSWEDLICFTAGQHQAGDKTLLLLIYMVRPM